jgi:TatD DNase family protein
LIDTHAHLDACAEDADTLISRARSAGVDRIVAIGSGIESCRATLAIAEQNEGVFAALGVHPHQAGGEDVRRLGELRALLENKRVVAVGETGLDFFRDYAPHDAQKRLFRSELELAGELGLPVVVHSRAADEDTIDALAGFEGTVVLHCFSAPRLLPAALERGYYVSFAGNVTFPNARDLRVAATQVAEDRLLVETDSPYLAPQPVRGRPNEPAHVVHTVAALAELHGVNTDELAARVDANAAAAFGLP